MGHSRANTPNANRVSQSKITNRKSMQSVQLGKSELVSSRIAYGCWRLGGSEGMELTKERVVQGQRAVIAAYEAGYTLFDNADIYGQSEAERIFGRALKEVSGMRDRILI